MTTRRRFLLAAGGVLAGAAHAQQLPPETAERRRAMLEQAVARLTGGAPVETGRVRLNIPPLIDNGNAVPVSIEVDSPMTADDHVTAIHLLTETNPQPYVISARFGPRAGRARVATRARIADTGTVMALARTSDGRFWSVRVNVVVTLPACTEESQV